MAKGIIFSDLHVHPHRFGASVDPATGKHSRLYDCLRALDFSLELVKKHDAKVRIFGGDMFHERGRLRPSVLNPVISHFLEAHNSKRSASFLDIGVVGNHDMEHRVLGDHALVPISDGEDVVMLMDHGCEGFDIGGEEWAVGWVSYEPDIAALKEKVRAVAAQRRENFPNKRSICIIHHGVDGTMPDIPNAGFGPMDLPTDTFTYTFCGDYHNHVEIVPGKAWMIGSPLQHNFGDRGQVRGIMVFDFDTGKYELVEVPGVPKFIAWDDGKTKPGDLKAAYFNGNFVRVRSDDPVKLDEMEKLAVTAGALSVFKELVKDWKVVTKADLTMSMTTGQMFERWLKEQDIPPDRQAAIITMNNSILEEAGIV